MAMLSLKLDSKYVHGGGGVDQGQVCVCTCPQQVRVKQNVKWGRDWAGHRSGTDFQTESKQVLVPGVVPCTFPSTLTLGTHASCFSQEPLTLLPQVI